MRPTIPKQRGLFAPMTEHKLADELAEVDRLLKAHPEWVRWVHDDLTKKRGVSADRGRSGMPASRVLRVILLKHRLKLSLRGLAPLLADSLSLREFLGLTLGDPAPKRTKLQDNVSKVRPETFGRILQSFAQSSEAREFESGEKVRVDPTVVKTNIHFPSDSSLLWDSVRVLTRLMKRASVAFAVEFEDRSKAAKKLHTKIYWARRKDQRVPAYRSFLDVASQVNAEVTRVLSELQVVELTSLDSSLLRAELVEELTRHQGLFVRVIDQTRRRVLEGKTVPAQEKVYSIFEPHTDMIKKSKTRSPDFGHKITLTVGKHFVLDCVIERGNPADVTLATRQLQRQKDLFGKAPRAAVFDGSFASGDNLDDAKALGVERCAFSKAKGLTPEEMAGSRRTHGRLKRFRAGVEGIISWLKRAFGLRRCTWKGWRRFQSYVWSAVLSANLTKLARLRLSST